MKQIGYSEFIHFCHVNDPDDWGGFVVKYDGVWVVPPLSSDQITSEERTVLSRHPMQDLSIPALPFPCTPDRFENFIRFYGFEGYVDALRYGPFIRESKSDIIDKSAEQVESKPETAFNMEEYIKQNRGKIPEEQLIYELRERGFQNNAIGVALGGVYRKDSNALAQYVSRKYNNYKRKLGT